MRKVFRVIYLLAMPILFLALLAICLSFEGTMVMTSTAATVEGTTTVGVNANCLINLNGIVFMVENFQANLAKQFKYTISGTSLFDLSLVLTDVTSGDPLSLGEEVKITLQMLSIIGIVVFGIGFFLSEVGYGSKVVTVLGAIILIGGSVCIFMDGNLDEGLRYILNVQTVQNEETVVTQVLNFRLDWLTIKLVAGIADGLTLLNVLFVLIRRKKIA